MTALIGNAPSLPGSRSEGKGFGLGDQLTTHDGKVYVYVQASGSITGDGYVVTIDEAYQAAMLTTSNDDYGDKVGVADAAFADDEFGWVQVYGPCGIRTAASAAANVALGATVTGGQVDDGAAVAAPYVRGMIVGTATGGAAAVNTTGSINWPVIGTVGEGAAS